MTSYPKMYFVFDQVPGLGFDNMTGLSDEQSLAMSKIPLRQWLGLHLEEICQANAPWAHHWVCQGDDVLSGLQSSLDPKLGCMAYLERHVFWFCT